MDFETFLSIYLPALIPAIVFALIAVILRRKTLFTVLGATVTYYISVCLLSNILPLKHGELLPEFADDGRIFGFIIKPFDYFPSGLDFFYPLFDIYWKSMVYMLVLGFISVITFKPLRKFRYACLFALGYSIVSAASIIVTDLILGGVNKSYDTSDTIVGLVTFFIGFLLAKAVLALVPAIAEKIDSKLPPRVRKEKAHIVRREVEK